MVEQVIKMKRTKLFGLVIAFVMLVNMAFAIGTINSTAYTGNPIYIDFNFSDVDGNFVDSIGSTDSGNWTHHGQTAGTGFVINKSGGSAYVIFSHSGAYGSGANVVIYKLSDHKEYKSFAIPLHQSGMGTLTTGYTLPNGSYYIKIVSNSYSNSNKTNGSLRLSGIQNTFN